MLIVVGRKNIVLSFERSKRYMRLSHVGAKHLMSITQLNVNPIIPYILAYSCNPATCMFGYREIRPIRNW